ncbi:MAG: PEGA domain-containing protein [Ignavibacteriales bacterium]|nr:MAG: PEGA domain-containing protein [Ignavibacteriales bacterium]
MRPDMDALSYVFVCRHVSASMKDVMRVASFFYVGEFMNIFKSSSLISSSRIITFLFAVLILSCKQAPTDAPAIITQITGKVTDKQNNQPIVGAQITSNPVTSSVVTGTDGNYNIPNVTPAQYTLTAKKDGYNDNTTTVTVTEGKTVNADIQLIKLSPELEVSPVTLDFGTTQTNLTFYITNKSKVGTVTWTITSNQQWLTVSPTNGTTTTETDPIQITASRNGLASGNYSGQITITSDAGDKTVNVLLTKPNPSAPQLSISPTTIDFGSSLATSQVELKNTGTGAMTWTSTMSTGWIILSSTGGNVNAGDKTILNVSVNKSGLAVGNYNGSILFNSNGGSQTLSLTMIVPQGTLTAPTLQLNGEPTTNSISIGWTRNTDAQFQSYKIYRSITSGVTENSTLLTTITTATNNLYVDNNLQGATTYYYRVFVYSNSGIGSGSNELSATTKKVLGSWVATNTISSINGGVTVNSLFPISENDVWLAADDEIWHYDGNSWTKSFTMTSTSNPSNSIFFLNSNLGWAVSNYGKMYQYNGISWTQVFSSTFSINDLYDIIAFSANDIWVSSYAAMYHYSNGQWTKTTLNASNIIDLDFIDSNNIWALDSNGKVFKYNGVGWALIQSLNTYNLRQLKTISNTDVWVATSYGSYPTYSGLWHYDGSSFISNYKLQTGMYYEGRYTIDFTSSNEGWSSLSSGKLSYFNGTSWQDVTTPVSNTIYCIRFLTNKKGWAVSSTGEILRYSE